MNQRDSDYFKKLLQQWLDALERQAGLTVNDFMRYDERTADPVDQAAREYERKFTLRIHNREDLLIRKIKQSIQDIKEGVYGICETCGGSIGVKRLKVRPVARHCIGCKTEAEKRERVLGL
jgi:DnaK suppressor protein